MESALPVIVSNVLVLVIFLNEQISIQKCEQIVNTVIYCGALCSKLQVIDSLGPILKYYFVTIFLFSFFARVVSETESGSN